MINEFLLEINKEKNDYSKIEKFKSLINNEKIIINNKLITNILTYISEKKEELKNNINNNIKEINKFKTSYEKEKFKSIKKNFETLDLNNKKQRSETSISKSTINKKEDFLKPHNPIDMRKSVNCLNNFNIKIDKCDNFKDIPLKGSFFSINSNDSANISNLII